MKKYLITLGKGLFGTILTPPISFLWDVSGAGLPTAKCVFVRIKLLFERSWLRGGLVSQPGYVKC